MDEALDREANRPPKVTYFWGSQWCVGLDTICTSGWILNQQYVNKLSSKATLVIPVVGTARSSTTSIE
jgi:hypothetical protein